MCERGGRERCDLRRDELIRNGRKGWGRGESKEGVRGGGGVRV